MNFTAFQGIKKPDLSRAKYPGRELNPYFRCGKLDFKSSASTNSATQVSGISRKSKKNSTCQRRMEFKRAEDEARTRDLNLGKVALYQLSYFRIKNYRILSSATGSTTGPAA